jgi:diphthamide biosynthesis protein 2
MAIKPKAICWAYHPQTGHLSTQPLLDHESYIRRYLNRRFYLIQRAALAHVFGIIVGTLSQQKFRTVISQIQSKIQNSGRACYTLAVGKIHQISKLTNFAEVDCFVLVACTETSILPNERDYHVPILTPHELDIALGLRTWDPSQWSCDYFDYLGKGQEEEGNIHKEENVTEDPVSMDKVESDPEDDDQPFYSLVTGKYESKKSIRAKPNVNPIDVHTSSMAITTLTSNVHGGQIMEYQSEAAEFWKRREYKGLEANVGQTEVQAAVVGQTGIASDYGSR